MDSQRPAEALNFCIASRIVTLGAMTRNCRGMGTFLPPTQARAQSKLVPTPRRALCPEHAEKLFAQLKLKRIVHTGTAMSDIDRDFSRAPAE